MKFVSRREFIGLGVGASAGLLVGCGRDVQRGAESTIYLDYDEPGPDAAYDQRTCSTRA